MNYSVELWDSYNKVENNLLFHLRGLKDFIFLLKELSKSMKAFSGSLKTIYDMNLSITTNESLSEGINNFRGFLILHHNFLEKYISNINLEIINPLNTFQETILKKLNKNYETINAEKNYESYINQVDFTKNKFHSRAKQVENKLLEIEQIKINKEKFLDKEMEQDEIDKLEEEAKNIIGFAKDSEKIYLSYIKYTNRIQEEFIEIKKKNLNQIQSLEIELGEKIKNSLLKYYSLQSNYSKNLNIERGKNIKLQDKINIYNDIEIYINNNKTNEIPPFRFDYIPYICNLDKQSINKDDELKNINLKVKEEIKSLFPEEKDISLLKTKTDKEIEGFIDSILKGEKENIINANEQNLKIVSNKNLRKLFLRYLNKLRNNTHLVLNDLSYKIIGNLLKESLSHSYKEKDFISIKLIMVIATNLFKINKVAHKPRIFLHSYLLDNQLWKNFNFWENMIKYDIVEEMHNQKKYNLYLEEDEVLKNVRIKNIVKKQLNINLYNMITFETSPSLMNKIINHFSNFYKLNKNAIESLNVIINNYKSIRIEIKERKKLNNSFDGSLKNTNNSNTNTNFNSNNNSKTNIFVLDKDLPISKNSKIIEPVKQDEEKINDCFEEIDNENKKKNIFQDENFNNITIKESKIKIKNDSD
jgi:hypothetical protein